MSRVTHTVRVLLSIATAAALGAVGCAAPSSGLAGSGPAGMVLGGAYEPDSTAALVSTVCERVRHGGTGVLTISHDESLLGVWADRVVRLPHP